MTIKELKYEIANLPDDMEVIISKDSEGNIFSPLCDIDSNWTYVASTTWDGEIFSMELSDEDACDEYDLSPEEWEEIKRKPKCLILSPTN